MSRSGFGLLATVAGIALIVAGFALVAGVVLLALEQPDLGVSAGELWSGVIVLALGIGLALLAEIAGHLGALRARLAPSEPPAASTQAEVSITQPAPPVARRY